MVLDLVKVRGPCLQRMVDETRSASRERIRTKKRERKRSLKIENIGTYEKRTHDAAHVTALNQRTAY
jgi:hypothetical protein